MNFNKTLSLFVGLFFILFGIYLSVVQNDPHFYTFFAFGFLIISILIYTSLSKKIIFKEWDLKKFILFFIFVLIASLIIDKIGLFLGYWVYPHYNSVLDDVVKYVFEWAVPLIAFMVIFMAGSKLVYKFSFVLIAGIITEYINSFVLSWQIIDMPILDYTLGVFNLFFVTVGYWLMALIPYVIYQFVNRSVK
ncbi:MAG: hypothetical protein ACP5NS_03740 [Candidatus Pacearchaeota archaeon]